MSSVWNTLNAKLGLPNNLERLEADHQLGRITAAYFTVYLYSIVLFILAALGLTGAFQLYIDVWVALITVNLFLLATLLGVWWGLSINGVAVVQLAIYEVATFVVMTVLLLNWITWLMWFSTMQQRIDAALFFTWTDPNYLVRETQAFLIGVVVYFGTFTLTLIWNQLRNRVCRKKQPCDEDDVSKQHYRSFEEVEDGVRTL